MKSLKMYIIIAVSVILFAAVGLLFVNDLTYFEPQNIRRDAEIMAEALKESGDVDDDDLRLASNMNLPPAKHTVLKIDGKGNPDVYLQSLDIQVEVTGNIASTRYTMVFKNKTDRVLEGSLTFPLPDGRSVTHYALDINGKMREGVPVEKERATEVFEEIEQRRVDPGLLERVAGNNFRTRVYPFLAHGTRIVSIGYEEELPLEKDSLRYRLPMDYPNALEKFSLTATVWKSGLKPLVTTSVDEFSFDKAGENYLAAFTRENYKPAQALCFSLPAPADIPQVMTQSARGNRYFLVSVAPKIETRKKLWDNDLAVIWDVSLSAMQRDLKRELDALNIIFTEKKNAKVHLYFLNNKLKKIVNKNTANGGYVVNNGNWDELKSVLKTAIFDGGTDFSQIDLNNIAGNEILFFSDGISTLSDADFIKDAHTNRPIHCIVSSSKTDYSAMKLISGKTLGKFVNINALSPEKLKKELLNETLQFLGTEHGKAVREVYPSIATPVHGNFSLSGISDDKEAELTLLFGFGGTVEKRITVKLDATSADSLGNVHKLWAQKKIAELDLNYDKNRAELTELGRRFGIVTRNTSLIVLETVDDYILYNIEPPAELQAAYQRKLARHETPRRNAEHNTYSAALTAKAINSWWNTDFPIKETAPENDTSSTDSDDTQAYGNDDSDNQSLGTIESIFKALFGLAKEFFGFAEEKFFGLVNGIDSKLHYAFIGRFHHRYLPQEIAEYYFHEKFPEERVAKLVKAEEVAATFEKRSEYDDSEEDADQPTITLKPIRQDNNYLKKLTGKTAADYQQYLTIRKNYAYSPTFYFDMADWFYKHGNKETALRVLTSIAELELEDASLYRLLGYRLKEYGEYALEKFVCRMVIQWRPMDAQSYRDYALALADNKEYQAALDSLCGLLTSDRSRKIEEVVIMEINRLIVKNKEINKSKVDTSLITNVGVDIRVVINWNMNNTDIDLHVKDPNNEECYYGHRQTNIGGRISPDITNGYGPEQFILKKAIKGKYRVYVNYYGDRQFTTEGPSTIMAEIFTKYADKNERRRIVCLQLSKAKTFDGERGEYAGESNKYVEVAEFEF